MSTSDTNYISSLVGYLVYRMLHRDRTLGRPLTAMEAVEAGLNSRHHQGVPQSAWLQALDRAEVIVTLSLRLQQLGGAISVLPRSNP